LGAESEGNSLATALFGSTRRAVLALLFGHPGEAFHMRQITRILDAGQGAVHRELKRLADSGILLRSVKGRQVLYQVNKDSPIFAELRSLMVKTAGVADALRTALAGLADRVDLALVYGSMANGSFKATSDVDVLVVGAVSFAEVVSALRPTEETLRREVNPSVYPTAEFRKRLAEGNPFLNTVVREPKVFLIGGERELAELVEERLAG
jgi:predicted nucleotidyltransferase